MKQFSLALLVVTIFCSATLTFAQESMTQSSKAKPIRIDKIPTNKLQIPNGVSVLGAQSYEFLIAQTGIITVNLYDGSNKLITSVTVQESMPEKTLIYKITENNHDEWLKIQSQEREDNTSFSVTSSAGAEMNVDVKTEKRNALGKAKVKGVVLSTETGLKTYVLDRSQMTESRLALQNTVQNEEQKLFATPTLQKLREFMQSVGILKDSAINKWSGQEKATTCNQESSNFIEEPAPAESPCSGTATCTRFVSAIPLFTCTSTNSACSGFFLIPECVINILCSQSCSNLNGCA